jgi:NADPH-dependent F420 reductase
MDMTAPKVGIIGGTGPQGRGLAMRLALSRLPVRIGSRQAARARDVAKELNAMMLATARGVTKDPHFPWIEGAGNADVTAASDVVLLTVPYETAEATLKDLRGSFRKGQVFVDVTVPLEFGKGDVKLIVPPEGSGSQKLRTLVPETVAFVGAGKTLPAHLLEQLDQSLECCEFVFGDDKDAKALVLEMLGRLPSLHPIDVGGMSAASSVEGMTMLLVRINRRLKIRDGRFSVVGPSW